MRFGGRAFGRRHDELIMLMSQRGLVLAEIRELLDIRERQS